MWQDRIKSLAGDQGRMNSIPHESRRNCITLSLLRISVTFIMIPFYWVSQSINWSLSLFFPLSHPSWLPRLRKSSSYVWPVLWLDSYLWYSIGRRRSRRSDPCYHIVPKWHPGAHRWEKFSTPSRAARCWNHGQTSSSSTLIHLFISQPSRARWNFSLPSESLKKFWNSLFLYPLHADTNGKRQNTSWNLKCIKLKIPLQAILLYVASSTSCCGISDTNIISWILSCWVKID